MASRERWGSPREYRDYYRLLLTDSGRKQFLWWLEKENPSLYRLVCKELKLDYSISQNHAPSAVRADQKEDQQVAGLGEPEAEASGVGDDLLAGNAEDAE